MEDHMTAAQKAAVKNVNAALKGTKVAPIKVTTAKAKTVKKTVTKPAAKAPVKRTEREQDSVTATMVRGKRDWKSRKIDTKWMPSSNGGVRFEEEADNGRSPHFMTQEDFAAMGEPKKIRVTVKALA
jgi:Tfp pilus assembly major pilin PilA